jgi:glycine dehydrogenase
MTRIHEEIEQITQGELPPGDNPLKNAPHTADAVLKTDWPHPYSRETAAFPLSWVREGKYWPPVARVDNVYGDRNLICACVSVEEAAEN